MNIIAGEEFLLSQKQRLEQYKYPSLLYEVRHKKVETNHIVQQSYKT